MKVADHSFIINSARVTQLLIVKTRKAPGSMFGMTGHTGVQHLEEYFLLPGLVTAPGCLCQRGPEVVESLVLLKKLF